MIKMGSKAIPGIKNMELKDVLKGNRHLINNFRHRKLQAGIIVTADHGEWELLSDDEFRELSSGSLKDRKLISKLEKKGIVLTANNLERVKQEYKGRYSFLGQGTSLHIVVVTLRCNQQCIYCQTSSRPENSVGYDMDEETSRKVVDFIFQSPSNEVVIEFQGGEPLLNFPAVKKITKYAGELNRSKRKDLKFSMVTNLTLMTEEILRYCIKNQISICTSLDGPKPLHDRNRPCAISSHERVEYWTRRINEEYRKNKVDYTVLNALITVTRDTLSYPKEVVDEYIRLGFSSMHLRFLSKLGYAGKNKSRIEYSPEEFISFWKKAVDYILELNKKGTLFTERTILIILKKILTGRDPNYLDMRSPCGAVIGQLAYNYNGDIYSCDEGRMLADDTFKVGCVKGDNYREVVCSSKSCSIVAASINDSQICDSCAYKPYCGLCPVCSYAEQGTTIGIIPETTFCRVYKAQFDYVFEKYLSDKSARKVFERWLGLSEKR